MQVLEKSSRYKNNTVHFHSRRRNSLSSITNSTTEDSNSNSSNSVERRQLNSQISLKHQKCNLLPDCNEDHDNKQEEWSLLASKNYEKPQEECKYISSSTSTQQDNDSTNNTANKKVGEEKEILSLQGKITNSSNAEGWFSPSNLIFYHLTS